MGSGSIPFRKRTPLRRRVAVALLSGLAVLGAFLVLGAPPDASVLLSLGTFALMLRPSWTILVLVVFVVAVYLAPLALWPFLPHS